ncbi:TniQ family protein [Streptomyces sp. DT24]|uniref:TniQ family protein n=1 Tax=unclassified Streptomyces TaxID=2593676 RepID=UPI003CF9CA20
MTLEPFDKITVNLRHQTRGLASPPHWRRHKGSRYCPTCLAESGGRWLSSWRSPWSFACTRRSRLLIDTCPGCGHRPHPSGRHPAGVRSPARCTMARGLDNQVDWARNPCNTDLIGPATRPTLFALLLAARSRSRPTATAETHSMNSQPSTAGGSTPL